MASTPLIVISSRTGNTMVVGRAICDAIPNAVLRRTEDVPDDLTHYNPILLGFWCDRGHAPDDIVDIAKKLNDKDIGCFATMGGDVNMPKNQNWMKETSEQLVSLGQHNRLLETFVCQGRIDPELFERMTQRIGGLTPEREQRRQLAQTHPDRFDLARAAEVFRSVFGTNW